MSIETIPVEDIRESPTNPRKTFGDLAELTESIRALGVLQPVLVRPVPDPLGTDQRAQYELVVGHRRYRAAREAGLRHLPAHVRDLGDVEAIEAQLAENLHREDVHPMEEAEAYAFLERECHLDLVDIAAKVGKSERYVRDRLVLTALCPEAREAFLAGGITIGGAVRLAHLVPADRQGEILEEGGRLGREEALRASTVAWWVEQHIVRRLGSAPFSTRSKTLLPEAGPCTSCPKRSDAQAELWGDDAPRDARCMDGACFEAKTAAAWEQAKRKAEKRGLEVIEEPSKDLFPYGDHLGRGYVKLDEKNYGDAKASRGMDSRTYRQILKDAGDAAPKPILVRSPNGAPLEVVPRKGLKKALVAAGAERAGASSERAREKLKARVKAEVERRAAGALADFTLTAEDDGLIYRAIARTIVATANADVLSDLAPAYGVEGRSYDAKDGLDRVVHEWDAADDMLAFIVRAAVCSAQRRTWSPGWDALFAPLLEAAGVDLEQLEREVQVELAPKKEGKKRAKRKKKARRASGASKKKAPERTQCSEDGCEARATARGRCRTHYSGARRKKRAKATEGSRQEATP